MNECFYERQPWPWPWASAPGTRTVSATQSGPAGGPTDQTWMRLRILRKIISSKKNYNHFILQTLGKGHKWSKKGRSDVPEYCQARGKISLFFYHEWRGFIPNVCIFILWWSIKVRTTAYHSLQDRIRSSKRNLGQASYKHFATHTCGDRGQKVKGKKKNYCYVSYTHLISSLTSRLSFNTNTCCKKILLAFCMY